MNLPIFLHASSHNGVYHVNAIDFYHFKILKPEYFLENINELEDGDIISTIIHGEDLHIYDEIKKQYNIK